MNLRFTKAIAISRLLLTQTPCRLFELAFGRTRETIRPFFEKLGEYYHQIEAVAMEQNTVFDHTTVLNSSVCVEGAVKTSKY